MHCFAAVRAAAGTDTDTETLDLACHDPHAPVPTGAVLDVLPPFSGG